MHLVEGVSEGAAYISLGLRPAKDLNPKFCVAQMLGESEAFERRDKLANSVRREVSHPILYGRDPGCTRSGDKGRAFKVRGQQEENPGERAP